MGLQSEGAQADLPCCPRTLVAIKVQFAGYATPLELAAIQTMA